MILPLGMLTETSPLMEHRQQRLNKTKHGSRLREKRVPRVNAF